MLGLGLDLNHLRTGQRLAKDHQTNLRFYRANRTYLHLLPLGLLLHVFDAAFYPLAVEAQVVSNGVQ